MRDLDRAVAFYRDGLGLELQGPQGDASNNAPLRDMFGLPDAKLRWQIARTAALRGGVEIIEISGVDGKPLERRFQDPGAYTLIAIVRDLDATLAGLKQLRARRHRAAIIQVLDPAELEFPFEGATLFRDLEIARETQVDPVALRAAYREEIDRFRRELAEAARHWGMEYYLMTTREPIDVALSQFLARHERLAT